MQNVTTNCTWTLGVTIIVRHFGHDSSMVTTATAPTPLTGSLTIASLAWVSAGSSRTLVDGDPEADGIDAATITTTALLTASDLSTTANLTTDITSYYERAAVVQALWISIIVLGALGNGLVIYTMGRHGERSATNYYIINLAVSDFAVLTIVVPFTITMFTSFDWLYGETMCKATVYLIYVTLQATCLTLTAMTIDRYFAIVHPISSLRDRTPRAAVLISLATWLASSFTCIPFIVYSRLEHKSEATGEHVYCVNQWPSPTWLKAVTVAFVMSTYVIPLLVIIVCYTLILKHLWQSKIGIRRETALASGGPEVGVAVGPATRRRRKVARMVFTVVLVFAVTWLPIHVFNLCFTLVDPFPRTEVMYNVKILCHTLSYLNSCLNPFIYAFLGDGFRRAFRKSFPRCTERNQVVPGLPIDPGPSTTAETRLAGSARENTVTRNICLETSPLPPVDN